MISPSSFPLLETTMASSLVEVAVSLENPLTTDGAGAVDAAADGETVVVAASHSSSVGDRDDDAANGSQKSQLDGGGGGGRQGEAVTEVYVSELGLIVGGAGGRRGGRGAGVGVWWWWGRESAKWRRAAPVERRERR